MNTEYDGRDYGDENDYKDFFYDEEEEYIDLEYDDDLYDEEDWEEGGSLIGRHPKPVKPSPGDTIDREKEYVLGMA